MKIVMVFQAPPILSFLLPSLSLGIKLRTSQMSNKYGISQLYPCNFPLYFYFKVGPLPNCPAWP